MAARSPTPAPIGAVVRALAVLRCQDDATRDAVLQALGWPAAAKEAPEPSEREPEPSPIQPPFIEPTVLEPLPLPERPPPPERRPPRPSTLTVLATPQSDEPDWLKDAEPLPLPDPANAVPLYAKPIEPLFEPLITRAILTRLAAVWAPVGEVDVERLVETVAICKPVTRLPRRAVLTLAKGLDLLIDHGAGMDPFCADIAGLVDDLALAVGRDRLTIRVFDGCPTRAVMDLVTAASGPYQPPPAGTPVLTVTDLGIGEARLNEAPLPLDEWLAFAAELQGRGNPLAVLTPWSRARIPAALRRALTLITWDRSTGARLNDRSQSEAAAKEGSDGATRLARIASIAGRIDPQFLRRLRLELTPDLGAEAEADLWASTFAQRLSVTGIVLKTEEQRRLQADLAAEGSDELTKAWELLFQLRTDRPWSERDQFRERNWLVAIEELTYWGLKGLDADDETRTAAKERLAQILKALLQAETGSEREGDALLWTRNARQRLPAAVQALEPMQDLLKGAVLRGSAATSGFDLGEVAGYLRPRRQRPMPVWLGLVDGGLEAALDAFPDGHRIEALALNPLLLRVGWRAADGRVSEHDLQLNPPRHAFLEIDGAEIEIATPDGTRVRLSRKRPTLLINVPPPPEIFVDREAELKAALGALLLPPPAPVTAEEPGRPLRGYIACYETERPLRKELGMVLSKAVPSDLAVQWQDAEFYVGDELGETAEMKLQEAELILLLMSPEFLGSKLSQNEIEIALRRAADSSALVIPIIAEDCDWRRTLLSELQVLPKDGRALGHADSTTLTMRWLELAGELENAIIGWRETQRRRQAAAQAPRVVALTGPDGIGKFTLARKLVHEPGVRERYPDGILWLGEDGQGYPRQWLRDYCEAVGISVPINEDDTVDQEAFRDLLAGRQVLFIAEFPSSHDILPTLTEHAGPGCTALVLSESRFSLPGPMVDLPHLSKVDAEELLAKWITEPLPIVAEIGGSVGHPLLLKVLATAGSLLPPEWPPIDFAGGDDAEAIESVLTAVRLELPFDIRQAAAQLASEGQLGSLFNKSAMGEAWHGPYGLLSALIGVGLLEDLGDSVRLHRLIRSAIGPQWRKEEVGDSGLIRIKNRRAIVDRKSLILRLNEQVRPDRDSLEMRSAALQIFKAALRNGAAEIRRRFEETEIGGSLVAHSTAFLVDQLMRSIWDFARARISPGTQAEGGEMAILAIGDYGRGELAPFSSIDVVLLLPRGQSERFKQVVEYVFSMLWECGMQVGHLIRSVDDCVRLAEADLTIRTPLLEARHVWGDSELFDAFETRFRNDVINHTGPAFVEAKLAERDARHERMGESRYVLEPDILEGRGGLRDLHTLFSIAKYLYKVNSIHELVDSHVFTKVDMRVFRKGENFLWNVRCHLHYVTGRSEERLTFNVQELIAQRLDYIDGHSARGVEQFMSQYRRVTNQVDNLTRVLCAVLAEEHKKPQRLFRSLSWPLFPTMPDGFRLDAKRLTFIDKNVVVRDPVKILQLFHVAQHNGLDIHPHALRLIHQNLLLIDARVRNDSLANRLFVEMLTSENEPEATLRRLRDAGVLGRLIPDFDRVIAQIRYNIHQVYPIDEQAIRAIGILSRIERGELRDDHPAATVAFGEIHGRRALYVAVLLSDIGRGLSGHHSVLGAEIALRLAPRLGLDAWETETVSWLVRHHLLMSRTAFMRDINDLMTVTHFIGTVQSPEWLRMLMILTNAGIRAVGLNIWNAWKCSLLDELYDRAMEEMEVLAEEETKRRVARVERAKSKLITRLTDWDEELRDTYIARGYADYWLAYTSEEQEYHFRLMREADRQGHELVVEARPCPGHDTTEVIVYAPVHASLFAQISGAIALAGSSIVQAKVVALANSMALGSFQLQDMADRLLDIPDPLRRLAQRIEESITGKVHPDRELERHRAQALPSRTEVFKVSPRIIFDNIASESHTVIEVHGRDRPSLLYDIAFALTVLGVFVTSAHISGYGERWVGAFYVKDIFGLKLDLPAKLALIEQRLLGAVDPNHPV